MKARLKPGTDLLASGGRQPPDHLTLRTDPRLVASALRLSGIVLAHRAAAQSPNPFVIRPFPYHRPALISAFIPPRQVTDDGVATTLATRVGRSIPGGDGRLSAC